MSKTLIPLQHFTTSTKSVYDPGWLPWRIASFIVGKPLWWALQQTGLVDVDEGGSETDAQRWRRVRGEYVMLALVDQAEDAILEHQREKEAHYIAESLYDFDSFRKEFASIALEGVTLSDQDLRVVLKFLERDKDAVVSDKGVSYSCIPYKKRAFESVV